MRLKLKENKMFIIVLLILILWALYACNEYRIFLKQHVDVYYEIMERCESGDLSGEEFKEACIDWKNATPESQKKDGLSAYFDITTHYSITYFQIFGPVFIILAAIYEFHRKLKSGYIKNILTRMEYKKFLIKSLLKSYRATLLFPIMLVIVFIGAWILSGHLDIQKTIDLDLLQSPLAQYIDIIPQFLIVYFINFILHGMFWINIGYIIAKRSRNIVVTIVGSLIAYIIVFMFTEIFVGVYFLELGLGIRYASELLNVTNSLWVYYYIDNYIGNLVLSVVYSLSLVIISLLILIRTYRNKEGVIVANES